MTNTPPSRLTALIDRLSRLADSEAWVDGLTPTQRAALSYLARANRFSRAPGQVAAYLAATKGTTSQTLKTLLRKGLVTERRSTRDRRSISFDLTEEGAALSARATRLEESLAELDATARAGLEAALSALLTRHLARTDGRRFGLCRSCLHHREQADGTRHCALLDVPLGPEEAEQICHEFAA